MGFSHLNISSDIKAKATAIENHRTKYPLSRTFYPAGNLNVFSQKIKDRLNSSMYSDFNNQ